MRQSLLVCGCLLLATAGARGGEEPSRLEFREIARRGLAQEGTPIPKEAVQVFVYEGEPRAMRVTEKHIEVDYPRSRVLFDRASGKPVRRLTIADGWAPPGYRKPKDGFVDAGENVAGPGVYSGGWHEGARAVVASATFDGRVWRAVQPTTFLREVDRAGWGAREKKYGTWTAILTALNEVSCVEAAPEAGGTPAAGFSTQHGLASNIVTRFAVADGALWAACADIYDPARNDWGPGGLCRFDAQASRWQQVREIEGRPVRWVSLLQAVGDELWVGFREGSGVAGDKVVFGMGIYAGEYRPIATAIVLARLSKGKWSVFSRPPLPNPPRSGRGDPKEEEAPTEKPISLGRSGERVILFSRVRSLRAYGSWEGGHDGCVSLLDLASGQWRHFDAERDFGADELNAMVAENGEILAASDRGAHRWDATAGGWRLLDPQCALRNPVVTAVAQVGEEAWIGYGQVGYGDLGEQGISRYNEKTGTWSHVSPKELGTSCPVHRILPLPGGDVWVLFHRQPLDGTPALDWSPRRVPKDWDAPGGLGCLHEGKWTFPVPVKDAAGKPVNAVDLAAVGGRIFIAAGSGVYAGPEPWTQVFSAQALRLSPSADGKVLLIACHDLIRHGNPLTLVRYYPASREVRWGANPEQPEHLDILTRDMQRRGDSHWCSEWVLVPTSRPGQWAVGPMVRWYLHWYVETPTAVWIVSRGELVRLDRGRLRDWLGK